MEVAVFYFPADYGIDEAEVTNYALLSAAG
jgi:hypothetical protein